MHKSLLHKKFHNNVYYPKLRPEIDQAVQVGHNLLISPNYTFYRSCSRGCRYIKNSQLLQGYGIFEKGGNEIHFYLILKQKDYTSINIPGYVSFAKLRDAYANFHFPIPIGAKGHKENDESVIHAWDKYMHKTHLYCLVSLCFLIVTIAMFIFSLLTTWQGALIWFFLIAFCLLLNHIIYRN